MHITPLGTGLIEPYDRGEYWEPHDADLYGDPVARITTYRVVFAPSAPEHSERLAQAVEAALETFKDIPYKYDIPSGGMFGNPSGNVYRRPGSRGSTAVTIQDDGTVCPHERIDLDDLWVLYYLLEPAIEPNAQIATAMDLARYAEERGAILDPDPVNYIDRGHDVSDTSGALQLVSPEAVMRTAVQDAFVDYALNKIDEAEFMVRMTTIAGHTMTGDMQDPAGRFAPHRLLPDEQGDAAPVAVQTELRNRVNALVRLVVGDPADPSESILDALRRTKVQVAGPLREHFRAQAKTDEIVLRQAISAKFEEDIARVRGLDMQSWLSSIGGDEAEDVWKEEPEELPPEPPAPVTQLVVQNSEVETQMDGLHAGGRYRTKTKGSLLVRKELPEALKPFIREHHSRVDPIKRLSDPVLGC